MAGTVDGASDYFWGMATRPRRQWVIVVSREAPQA